MKIHGAVWLIVGIIVAGFSAFIESIKETANLTIFFYVGVAFGVFGLFKLIVGFINPKEKPQKEHVLDQRTSFAQRTGRFLGNDLSKVKENQDILQEKRRLMELAKKNRESQYNSKNVRPQNNGCPRCGVHISSGNNFCFNCGQRLR